MHKEHHLTPEELRAVQLIELELLLEADRICRKHSIKYSITEGAMLSAVRHQGFIPWEDEADMGFLRPEYERFRDSLDNELNHDCYYFQDHRNTPGYRHGYGKLRRRGTEYVLLGQEHMPYDQGVYINIYPYDSVPARLLPRLLFTLKCFFYREALWSYNGRFENNLLKRLLYKLLSCYPEKKLHRKYNNFAAGRGWQKTGWVRILTCPKPKNNIGYKSEWLEQTAPVRFEGHEFSGVKDFDEYLTFEYGRYMRIPPDGQRKIRPVSRIKLPEPYFRFQILYKEK